MTTFRSRFQISGIISTKDSISNSSLLNKSSLTSIIKENVRNFWIKSKKKPIKYKNTNMDPSRVEPCKGCPSKCLENDCGKLERKRKTKFFRFKKASIKEKPSNCVKEKPVEAKLTLWEELFGPDPKRSWPDPCTCRIANHQKKQQRQEDPRLLDSRYQETAGDVFLYTELLKTCRSSCLEPQPKPPPSFKLPKAAICKMINKGCEKIPVDKVDQTVDDRFEGNYLIQRYKVPYEELRPSKKWKQPFNFRQGIRSENIILKPVNKELNFAKVLPTVQQVYSQLGLQVKDNKLSEQHQKDTSQIRDISEESVGKRSRVEQLKMLVQIKNASQCILKL